MTIEELEALAIDAKNYKEANTIASLGAISGVVWELMPEILALVEACNQAEFDACNEDEGTIGSSQIEAALFAFNVKLRMLK